MPSYTCHKRVWALEIASVSHADPGGITFIFKEPGFAPLECGLVGDPMLARYTPQAGDFLVVYEDGYKSFSPRKAFLDGYTEDGESFAEIKQGLKARNPE
jgi:hypothetical protein